MGEKGRMARRRGKGTLVRGETRRMGQCGVVVTERTLGKALAELGGRDCLVILGQTVHRGVEVEVEGEAGAVSA